MYTVFVFSVSVFRVVFYSDEIHWRALIRTEFKMQNFSRAPDGISANRRKYDANRTTGSALKPHIFINTKSILMNSITKRNHFQFDRAMRMEVFVTL